jgi:hypothetical protein
MPVSINYEQRLFVIPCAGGGFTCLAFDVCRSRARAIAKELDRADLLPTAYSLSMLYEQYERAVKAAMDEHRRTGRRLTCELTPQLVGLEGKRVRVKDKAGERRTFVVGRSSGFIPVHIELPRRRSMFGIAVSGTPFDAVEILA